MKKIQKTLVAVVIGFMTLTVSANPTGGEQEYLKKAESKYIAHNIEGAISDLSKAIEINLATQAHLESLRYNRHK